MSEHSLPDDVSRWPTDPFAILGLRRGSSERDIRRAYARLIRTYKPEHFPEQFRRIRDAYESAKRLAEIFGWSSAEQVSFSPPADDSASAEPALEGTAADSPQTGAKPDPAPRPRAPSFDEELEAAWDWAVEGDYPRAYSSLVNLQQRNPRRAEIYLRLYFLLTAEPELNPRRSRFDYLLDGFSLGTHGAFRELLEREIEADPEQALEDRYWAAVEKTFSAPLVVTLVQWRWTTAGRRQRLEVIASDLPKLRVRFAVDHEELWLRLLSAAVEQLAWGKTFDDSALLAECCAEAARYEHLQLRIVDVFNRLDNLERLGRQCHEARLKSVVPAELLDLLARYWLRPFEELRDDAARIAAQLGEHPILWLKRLDALQEVAPQLVSVLSQMLASYEATLELPADSRNAELIIRLIEGFLDENALLETPTLRLQIAKFCVYERIHPDSVTQVVGRKSGPRAQVLYERLANDRALRCVYQGARLSQL